MKNKIYYVCTHCGAHSAKWLGRCPNCGEWNSLVEEKTTSSQSSKSNTQLEKPVLLSEITNFDIQRISVPIDEFNRVLGGGIVPGSVILIGGDPGIGKSTLLLQVSGLFQPKECLYISGEESKEQIALRAKRVLNKNQNFEILAETNLDQVLSILENSEYKFVVIDSIQSIYSTDADGIPGSLVQIRESTQKLTEFAKRTGTAVFLIGHVTKEGFIAGPKVLEHIVDVVLQFEGEKNYAYRILRTLKNRFGSTNEIGIFEMVESGLKEVKNPSEIFLADNFSSPGVSISAVIEGSRPMLIEVQGLVTSSGYSYPQRTTNGFDMKRLQLILAVLEKRLNLTFSNKDVFVNIAGGFRIDDTALDLAVALSLISSNSDMILPDKTLIIGEVGLTGEVRSISHIEPRLIESEKLGFNHIVLPKASQNKLTKNFKLKYTFVESLLDAFLKIIKR